MPRSCITRRAPRRRASGRIVSLCATVVAWLLVGVPQPGRAASPGQAGLIAWTHDAGNGNLDVFVMAPDGTGQRSLVDVGQDGVPDWSPDGGKLAFSGNGQIYTVAADGSGLRNITNDTYFNFSPTWSRDGARIAYTVSVPNATVLTYDSIVVRNADGTGLSRLTNPPGVHEGQPEWSPDGRWVTFVRYTPSSDPPSGDIWAVSTDGARTEVKLTANIAADRPDWSPDGRKIAFSAQDPAAGDWELDTIDVPATLAPGMLPLAPTNLTRMPSTDDKEPAWSPDGTRIAFTRSDLNMVNEIFVLTLADTNPGATARQLTKNSVYDQYPDWQPLPPGVRVDPATLDFGSVDVATASAVQRVTVSNTGRGSLSIASAAVSGGQAADFRRVADGCSNVTLAPGSSCEVQVNFVPGAPGARSAALVVTSNGPGSPHRVTLQGTGRGAPPTTPTAAGGALRIDPPLRDFGERPVGDRSAPDTFTVQNTGAGSLKVTGAGTGGPQAAEFVVASDTCTGNRLAPGARCQVGVRFAPGGPGLRRGLLFVNTDTGGDGSASLTGTGRGVTGVPTLAFDPPLGQAGRVTVAVGAGFPPNSAVTVSFDGLPGSSSVKADAAGAFRFGVLVFPHVGLGPHLGRAQTSGATATAPYLVVPSPVQPSGFGVAQLLHRR